MQVDEEVAVPRVPVDVQVANSDDLPDLVTLLAPSGPVVGRARIEGATVDCGPDPRLTARLEECLRSTDTTVLLARSEGRPVGVCVMVSAPSMGWLDAAAHIVQLHVAPAHRRRGVGKALMAASLGTAERLGADQITMGAPPAARETHRFLARLGFTAMTVQRGVPTATLRRALGATTTTGARRAAVRGTGHRAAIEDLLARRRLRRDGPTVAPAPRNATGT